MVGLQRRIESLALGTGSWIEEGAKPEDGTVTPEEKWVTWGRASSSGSLKEVREECNWTCTHGEKEEKGRKILSKKLVFRTSCLMKGKGSWGTQKKKKRFFGPLLGGSEDAKERVDVYGSLQPRSAESSDGCLSTKTPRGTRRSWRAAGATHRKSNREGGERKPIKMKSVGRGPIRKTDKA